MARQSGGQKEGAEGAIYGASIMPQLHACDPATATLVLGNLNKANPAAAGYSSDNAANLDFQAVKVKSGSSRVCLVFCRLLLLKYLLLLLKALLKQLLLLLGSAHPACPSCFSP